LKKLRLKRSLRKKSLLRRQTQLGLLVFHVLVTILLQQLRAWVFLVQWLVQETILSQQTKAWVAQVLRALVLLVQVDQVVQLVLAVLRLVQVDQGVQLVLAVHHVLVVLLLVQLVLVLQVALQVLVLPVVVQVLVVAVAAAEQPVRSVRVDLEVLRKHVSRREQSVKNLNYVQRLA
jgi:hypothetical protein